MAGRASCSKQKIFTNRYTRSSSLHCSYTAIPIAHDGAIHEMRAVAPLRNARGPSSLNSWRTTAKAGRLSTCTRVLTTSRGFVSPDASVAATAPHATCVATESPLSNQPFFIVENTASEKKTRKDKKKGEEEDAP